MAEVTEDMSLVRRRVYVVGVHKVGGPTGPDLVSCQDYVHRQHNHQNTEPATIPFNR